MFKFVTRAILLVFLCSASFSVHADDPGPVEVPAGKLITALESLARQIGVELVYRTEQLEGLTTRGVSGTFSAEDAIKELLEGTPLTLRIDASGAMLIAMPRSSGNSTRMNYRDAGNGAAVGEALAVQSDAPGRPRAEYRQNPRQESSAGGKRKDRQIEEIVVTGTRIRGAQSVSPVVIIGREEIDHAGYATVTEALQSLPQNFSGGPNQDTGPSEPANISSGSSANLRGLGTGSTLVLVNGRRQAPSGRDGGFVDVSGIPLSAVDRIEVLTDGASAIYGADAVGGVVNIILRTDYDGAETRLRSSPDIGNDVEAFQFGQVYGRSWSTGNLLTAYEFDRRGALSNEDRPYLATSDLRPLGGDDFRDTRSQPGNILSATTPQRFAIPSGQDGRSLEFGDLTATAPNLENQAAFEDVLPEQEQHSAFVTINQDVGEQFGVFAEARFRRSETESEFSTSRSTLVVPRSNAFADDALFEAVNGIPASQFPFLFVEYSFADDLGPVMGKGEATSLEGVLGANASIGSTWKIETYVASSNEEIEKLVLNQLNTFALNAALADSDPATAFNPFGDGSNTNPDTVDSVGSFNFQNMKSSVSTINLMADGSLMSLSGGELKMALGVDHREQDLTFRVQEPPRDTSSSNRDLGRNVSAVFAELFIPLVGTDNAKRLVRQFDVSVAARYEDYSDFGATVNPKVGLLWSPTAGVKVRSTFGTSFKAPGLEQLRPGEQAAIRIFDDPDSPTGETRTLVRVGNNPDLTEETADVWSLGLEIQPASLKQLRFSLNYFDIEYDDRISRPDSFSDVHQERYSGIVNADPTQAELDAVCQSPDFIGDPTTCTTDLVEALADARLRNIAITNVAGIDFSASYERETKSGNWILGLDGTHFTEYSESFSASAPVFDIENTIGNPIDFRARGNVSWSLKNFGVSAFINYADSYVDNVSIPERKIDSHTTVDLHLRYDSGLGREFFNNWVVTLSVLNMFNEDPPFANTEFGGYDRSNADPLRRRAVLQVRKSW